ncbi:MAG: glutamate--tRNA ligase [Bacteroidota bacterium]
MIKMRVRFAPSPTGALHIGGVRTALYDYLLAKKHGGTFVLRIEDTDQKRYVEGAEAYILNALRWCGLEPDEGPGIGGNYGPYRQSERKDIYQKYIQQLLDSGHAYYAFDTAEDLEAMRERMKAAGKHTFQYDASTRMAMKNSLSLSESDVKTLLESGTPYTIRFKMPEDEAVTVHDLIRAEVTFQTKELDDKVLMKSDGLPTYHLANVVDDRLMEITHVIRGEEWLPSTGLHVLMYRAFGWEDDMPKFAHLPLILKPAPTTYINKKTKEDFIKKFSVELSQKHDLDLAASEQLIRPLFNNIKDLTGQLKIRDKDSNKKKLAKGFLKDTLFGKLSKRDGDRLGFPVFPLSWKGETKQDTFVGFKEVGFNPHAVNNFLVFLGWNPGTEQEQFSMDQMIEAFSLERVGKSGARFDYDKARWFNQQYLVEMDDRAVAEILYNILGERGIHANKHFLSGVASIMKKRVHFVSEILDQGYYFFEPVKSYDEETIRKRWKSEHRGKMNQLLELVKTMDSFDAATIENEVKAFMAKHELGFGDVLPILRLSVSGKVKGPSVFDIMALIGQQEVVKRMEVAYDYFETLS